MPEGEPSFDLKPEKKIDLDLFALAPQVKKMSRREKALIRQKMEMEEKSGKAQKNCTSPSEDGLFKSVFLPEESLENETSIGKNKKAKRTLLRHAIHKNEEEDSRTVFVGNICNTATRKEIKSIFKECGSIEAVRIRCQVLNGQEESNRIVGRAIRVLRGDIKKDEKATAVAYVLFENSVSAVKALEKNSLLFNGRHIVVTGLNAEDGAYPPETSIFLGNIAYNTTEEDIWSFFALHDVHDIKRVRLIRNRDTGTCKGFGYVEFRSSSSVKKAIDTRGNLLNGREIRIVHANKAKSTKNAAPSRRELRQMTVKNEDNISKRKRSRSASEEKSNKTRDDSEKTPWMGMVTNPRRKIPKDLRLLAERKR